MFVVNDWVLLFFTLLNTKFFFCFAKQYYYNDGKIYNFIDQKNQF